MRPRAQPDPPPATATAQQTWNDAETIAENRRMTSGECLLAAIELSRAAMLFADANGDDR